MADITVDITDPSGKLVRSLAPPHMQHPGEALIVWDGRDNSGKLVAVGEYRIGVTARPTYGRPMRELKKELGAQDKPLSLPSTFLIFLFLSH